MPESFEVAIIGAGLVGLATARALLRARRRSLVVIDAEDQVAAHQSGHNSGVLHSGLYYSPGSAKAALCRSGRKAMIAFCKERGIAHEICGKLVVATRPDELPRLAALEERGRANGLQGLRRLQANEIQEFEPHAVGLAALHVPEAGIVDFPAVAHAMAEDVREMGGELRLGERVLDLQVEAATDKARGQATFPLPASDRASARSMRVISSRSAISCSHLVNCAGVRAQVLAKQSGLETPVRILPFRGEYKMLRDDRKHLVRNLIYPVPDPRFPFLGVHFTRRVDGSIEAGPNAVLALARDGYRWRDVHLGEMLEFARTPALWKLGLRHWRTAIGEVHRSLSDKAFALALARLLPDIRATDLRPGGSGVRAQALDAHGQMLDDFHLEYVKGATHVLCAPSPAATASIVIGEEVAQRAGLNGI
ncbi:MAG: L-2-hydroxyglutarate oxidase [Planctomycetota bacterium]|jgi:L-2-hydroxyglutarate oxidase